MLKLTSLVVVLLYAIGHNEANLTSEEIQKARDALYSKTACTGDMHLTKSQKAKARSRIATNDLFARWPHGHIPYVIDSSAGHLRGKIIKAADHFLRATGGCVRWVPRTFEPNYVRIFKEEGCWSLVGKAQDSGPQNLSLGDGCEFFGTVVHEMLHAAGFDHEHNRPDRDKYLTINYENIKDGMEKNFDVITDGLTLDDDFDWNSIMLYGETAFSKDGVLATMQDTAGVHQLTDPFEKTGMSTGDANQVKKFYECK